MSNILKYTFEFNTDKLKEILLILKELSSIDDMIKIKMDEDEVMFYSKSGVGNNLIALKLYKFPIYDFIIADEYKKLDFIIINSKTFIANLELLLKQDNPIMGRFEYREQDKVASMLYITDGKIKLNYVSGDYRQIRDLSKDEIQSKMDTSMANFTFTLNKEVFDQLKKLTKNNKSDIVSIRCKKGKLAFFDKRWNIDIQSLPDVDDETWSFSNKYLKSINVKDSIDIHMFDSFLLFKDDNVLLLIGLELSFD